MKTWLASILIAMTLLSCSQEAPPPTAITPVVNELACRDGETRLFDRLIDRDHAALGAQAAVWREELLQELSPRLRNQNLIDELRDFLRFLYEEAPRRAGALDTESRRRLYAALEIGTGSTDAENELVKEYEEKWQPLWRELQNSDLSCAAAPRVEAQAVSIPRVFQENPANPAVGMRWSFATAYQSCESIRQRAMTAATPDVQGITAKCCHPDGVGQKRTIANLTAVLATHPYLHAPENPSACWDVRTNPLIYDYGGKPYPETSRIDLHRNAGDGTVALGIDCSGFVSASLATSGLKFRSSVPLRPSQAGIYSSHAFLNPEANKMDCLKRIEVGPEDQIKDGDIVAIAGHVFMVDDTGRDPFGLFGVPDVSSCEKITTAQFRFTVYQSSNSKGGVGLNRFAAADYLPEKATLRDGMVKYAKAACRARFTGQKTRPTFAELSVTRHLGTVQCRAARVPLVREACIESCFGG